MKTKTGFSLIELMSALTILAILTLIALPSLTYFSDHSNALLTRDQLLSAIHLARQQADIYGRAIAMCPNGKGQTCQGEWEEGQLIFIDENETGEVNTPDDVLFILHPKPSSGKLHWRVFPDRRYLSFYPDENPTANNASFWYCAQHKGTPDWAIIINQAHRERVVYPDKKGVIKDGRGKELAC